MDFFLAEANVPVLLPIVATAAIALCFFVIMRSRRGALNLLEVGALYVGVVTLYTVFPLLGFLLNGCCHTPANDWRLWLDQPSSAEMALVGWFCVVHLLSFALAYVIASGSTPIVMTRFRNMDSNLLPCALVLYLVITAFLLLVDSAYDLSAETYVESYLLPYRLPLFLGQCYRVLYSSRQTLEIVILVLLGCHWRTTYPLIAFLIALAIILTFIDTGSRGRMVLLSVAVALTYQHLVRPLRLWQLAVGALSLLFLFVLAGIVRNDPNRAEPIDFFGRVNEFESIFANAYHVHKLKQTGQLADLPPGWYASDFLRLIPPQVRPLDGTNPLVWYVETYFPEFAAQGGSMCFGTVAESIVGWGWPDLVWRGLAVGLLLGMAHRYRAAHQDSFWAFVFYVWLAAYCYWSFRGTTFFLLAFFFYFFLPTYLALRLLSGLINGLQHGTTRARPACHQPQEVLATVGADPDTT